MVAELERDLDLVALSGVEDKLQHNVRGTLEMLRNAGIRVWMLTGDKVETATCIVSARVCLLVRARARARWRLTAACRTPGD